MAVWVLGSINADHFYGLANLPRPGETIAASSFRVGLGGKGANQAIAAARAGTKTRLVGAAGPDAGWILAELRRNRVDIDAVARVDTATGHAIVMVEASGENSIVIHAGANRALSLEQVEAALGGVRAGDTLLLQNETNLQVEAAKLARSREMRVVYSAAPFEIDAVRAVVPYVTLLALNAVEMDQLSAAPGMTDIPEMVVTRGAEGASWTKHGQTAISQPAFPVIPIDTTGAGDCFVGSLAASLDSGASRQGALRYAAAAAALQVTRKGTAEATPFRAEVLAFLANHDPANAASSPQS